MIMSEMIIVINLLNIMIPATNHNHLSQFQKQNYFVADLATHTILSLLTILIDNCLANKLAKMIIQVP